MNRNYAYRLYPNHAQAALLARVVETHRRLYNAALQERRDAWQKCRVSRNYYDQANQLKAIRAFDEDAAWLNYTSIQQTLRRLDKAFAAFFRRVTLEPPAAKGGGQGQAGETPGYPRFEGRKWFNTVEYRWGDGVRLTLGPPARKAGGQGQANRLHIQNVGAVKMKWHREIPADATIKCLAKRLKRQGAHWYAVFALELPDPECAPHPGPTVGLDLGLKSLVALSDGTTIAAPRHFRAAESKLAEAQRILSRRIKFSGRWRKQARLVAGLHRRTLAPHCVRRSAGVANQRRDFAHKLARQLAETYSLIAVENLSITALARSALAKSVHDAGWRQLLDLLTYKAESAGGQVVAVDPRHTSQRCSGCGATVPKDLSVRVHDCLACGLTLDRDVNAARNILALGLSKPAARTEPWRTSARNPRVYAEE